MNGPSKRKFFVIQEHGICPLWCYNHRKLDKLSCDYEDSFDCYLIRNEILPTMEGIEYFLTTLILVRLGA